MEMEYWPQHKVFFIAILVLFPKRLKDSPITEMFYKPYFARDDVAVIEATLQDYQKDGYLKYKESGEFGWQITAINTQKAADDLTDHLQKWQRDELLSLPASRPPDAAHQQTLLLNAIARTYANHQKEPRITLRDVYGKPSDYDYEPPFWELVLACQLLDKNVEIKYMDYDKRTSGLYDDNAQPIVDLRIASKEFEQSVRQHAARTDTREAHVFMQGRYVCVAITGDRTYPIAKLGENTSHYLFMNHLLAPGNSNINITIDEIKGIKKGLQAAHDLTELVRYCGFDRTLKKAFFSTSKQSKIHFKPIAQLDDRQVEAVKKQAAKLKAKNRKQIGNKS